MPEIPDVVALTEIESSWGNLIRDRTILRYADATARDASEPTPTQGRFCYLSGTDVLQMYQGAAWVTIGNASGPYLSKGASPAQSVASEVSFASAILLSKQVYPPVLPNNSGTINGPIVVASLTAVSHVNSGSRFILVWCGLWIQTNNSLPAGSYDYQVGLSDSGSGAFGAIGFDRHQVPGAQGGTVKRQLALAPNVWVPSSDNAVMSATVTCSAYGTAQQSFGGAQAYGLLYV